MERRSPSRGIAFPFPWNRVPDAEDSTRKFVEAQKLQPKGKTGRADKALALIGRLYRIEREARALPDHERLALRQAQSRAVIDDLRTWLDKSLARVPPKGPLGRALHYLHGQWPKLVHFLEDARIPLDNNPAENAIRPFVNGRKNWLFSHTPKGAQASAALSRSIASSRRPRPTAWSPTPTSSRSLRAYRRRRARTTSRPCCPGDRNKA